MPALQRFSSRGARRAAVGLSLAIGVIGTAGPAHAERDVHRDQQRDVRRIDTTTDDQVRVSGRADPDVRRTTVTHRSQRVVVRLEVAELSPGLGHLVAGRIRTATGDADFGWSKEPGEPAQGGLKPRRVGHSRPPMAQRSSEGMTPSELEGSARADDRAGRRCRRRPAP